MITTAKDNYFASLGRKLSNPNIGIKKYWSTLNRIINKKNVWNIPPLIENSMFVTNFQEKANIFNNHFVQQCSLNINESVYPGRCVTRCNKLLETIDINGDNVLKIIRSLDCNKAHGWDDLSVSMLKICDYSIVRPLCLIYKEWLETGNFPELKKSQRSSYSQKREQTTNKKLPANISVTNLWENFWKTHFWCHVQTYLR